MEEKKIESIILPPESMLIKEDNDKDNRPNYFGTQIFIDEIQSKDKKEDKDENKLIKELEDILVCCICYNYLDNPVNDPSCCPHYACQACLENYFKKRKSNIIPCPLCRKYIKKNNLVKIPIIQSIKEIIKEAQKNKNNEDINGKIDEMCQSHPKNKVFSICLDCRIKMCPICDEEKKKHENHHVVNYERYIKLFYFIQDKFAFLKDTIAEKEQIIKEGNKLYDVLEQRKKAYISFLEVFSRDVKKIFSENQEKINKNIAESMKLIAKLRNFMINIKKNVSKQFQNDYNDIDNLEEIKEEIANRVDNLKLKQFNNEKFNIKDYKDIQLNGIIQKAYTINVNKKLLLDKSQIQFKCDKDGNYLFGIQEDKIDKNMITVYLDVNKIIDKLPNYSSYIVKIEINKEKHYLLPYEIDKQYYSFEKTILMKELFDGKVINSCINLYIYSLNLK